MAFSTNNFRSLADFTDTNIIASIIEVEGGYVNNKDDRGGETNFGITKDTARANGYMGDMRSMTKKDAYDIYYKAYWQKYKCPELAQIHPLLAFHVFDLAVHGGSGRAGQHLQRLLNVSNRKGQDYADIGADGVIGNGTLRALDAFVRRNGQEGLRNFIITLVGMQANFYISITENRPDNETFMNGWMARAASKLLLVGEFL